MQNVTIVAGDEAATEDLLFVEHQINEFNFATTEIHDARRLAVLLRDDSGRSYAGLSGHTRGGVAEVRLLWVDASRRHAGIDSHLLHTAEQEARSRGCKRIV